MRSKEKRIPVHLEFTDDIIWKDEFIARLHCTELFMISYPADEYFKTITDMLLNDEDSTRFISEHEPEYEGFPLHKIIIASQPINTTDMVFIYCADMVEEEFYKTSKNISEVIIQKYISVIFEYSGIKSYRWYFNTDLSVSKLLADSYFYTGNFSKAGSIYLGIRKTCTPYALRMAEWCEIISRELKNTQPHAFDILLLIKSQNALFSSLGYLCDERRVAVGYWLLKQELHPGKALLNLYLCARGFFKMGNSNKVELMMEKIKSRIDIMSNNSISGRSSLWKSTWRRITEEFKMK
ncbi:hypothetical protein PAEPH01_1311 [Pancytospora epiphaga]|nr:hypothetical protein PAEPH01_1311 [Pancytospora epiphaga]